MSLYVTARFTVREEGIERVKAAIARFTEHVDENEPGTRLYMSMQDEQDPNQFLHFMIFEDETADEIHRSSEAVRQFTEALYQETVGDTDFARYHEFVSTSTKVA